MSAFTTKRKIEDYGWTAVPRNRSEMPSAGSAKTQPAKLNFEADWPPTEVVRKAREYIQKELSEETYNHSIRVYHYGQQIVLQHFPSWLSPASTFLETWALTCLFHDLATTPSNRASTHLSFEWRGGYLALEKLQQFGAPIEQAESVAEAIIRHQDPGETGTITRMGFLVQITTEFDNMGWQPHLVDKSVIEQAVKAYPRKQWSSCFSKTIREEIAEKPWCHSTVIPGFAEAVEGNKLMAPYE